MTCNPFWRPSLHRKYLLSLDLTSQINSRLTVLCCMHPTREENWDHELFAGLVHLVLCTAFYLHVNYLHI